MTLNSDLFLTGTDVLEMNGTPDQPCTIEGNNHQVLVTGAWSGKLKLNYVRIHNLGTSQYPPDGNTAQSAHHAFWLPITTGGSGSITNCVFDASSSVYVYTDFNVPFTFNNNTVLPNSLVPARSLSSESFPFFQGEGPSVAPKLFQGNHIYKAYISFRDSPNWVIGGPTDAESNILVGVRAGIGLEANCPNTIIRGNYVHHIYPTDLPFYNQATSAVLSTNPDLVVMDNIFREGARVVKSGGGVFARNVVLDAGGEFWFVSPHAGQLIHHNIFAQYSRNMASVGILHVESDPGIQVYNNVLDGGGAQAQFGGPAIQVADVAFLASVRNNVFYRFTHALGYASIDNGNDGLHDSSPLNRLAYADYNLFFNLDSIIPTNYALTVAGLRLRLDPGFALNDAQPHGAINQQVDPKFAGPVPTQFPFDDAAVKSGAVPVSQILAAYRSAYAPAANSPLVDAGDPQDGPGTDIGAVERGAFPSSGDAIPPPAPVNLQIATSTGVVLSWNPGSHVDLAQYRVYQATSPSGPFTLANATVNMQGIPPTAVLNNLQAGEYYFRVTAVDTSGNESPRSNLVTTGQASTYSISGTVTAGGTPIAGATVSAGGTSVASGANGAFSISGLLAGNYQVAASASGYLFTPVSVSVGPNAQGISITGTLIGFTVGGKVTAGGVPLSGVGIYGGPGSAVTAADGTYTLTGFTAGAYLVQAFSPGYSFASQVVQVGPSQGGVNFTAPVNLSGQTYTVSGKVTAGGVPLSGVGIYGGPGSAVTAADGTYTLTGFTAGAYLVQAFSPGYSFASQVVQVGPSQGGVDFTAPVNLSGQTYMVSGKVTVGGVPVAGVGIYGGPGSTVTAADGTYTLTGFTAGAYLVQAFATGYTFPRQVVQVGPNQTGINFAGQ